MKRIIFILLAFICFVSSVTAQNNVPAIRFVTNEKQVTRESIAADLIGIEEYSLALQVLENYDTWSAASYRMEAFNGLGKYRNAIECAVKYLYAYDRVNEGKQYMSSYHLIEVFDVLDKDYKYAARKIQKCLTGDKWEYQLRMVLGRLHHINGNYDEAISQYQELLKIGYDEDIESWLNDCQKEK